MITAEEKLAKLREKQAQLKAQEKKIIAQENAKARKARTKRLIEIGAAAESILGRPFQGDTPTRVLANGRGFLRHGRTPQRAITSPLHPVTSLPLSRLFCGCLF